MDHGIWLCLLQNGFDGVEVANIASTKPEERMCPMCQQRLATILEGVNTDDTMPVIEQAVDDTSTDVSVPSGDEHGASVVFVHVVCPGVFLLAPNGSGVLRCFRTVDVMGFLMLPRAAGGNCSGPRWVACSQALSDVGGCCRNPRCRR